MQAKERTDLRALYDQHASALFGFAVQLCSGDRGRAEDIVQETLVRAWQHLPEQPPGRQGIRPWLFTVARRIAIDQHRRSQARPDEVAGVGADQILMSTPDDTDLEESLNRIVILDALAALSAEHREVLMQTYYAGHTVAEAARVLQIPVGTVKSRAFYALKALHLALMERGMTQ
ncbi:sigma-70 family RNA polymerase sigma factor [Allobranchiibius sp. CTAmp26]|uniref:sigma-70 family RNA polymerase sigma factor n=1 Tax=Allobranchiibius sp. CTAmp26 TaxID=2815214 RepID=UPI0027DC845C|nr:sigma-70 family RNA polymerase sigma factor [Allobranchiibius sp. CTAmp26]